MAEDPTPTTEQAADTAAAASVPPESAEVALQAEVADLKDRLLRLAAEMENLRKRTEREIADARQYSVAKFAQDVLTIADNLGRTLAAMPAEAREAADAGLRALVEGVELTERELQKTLAKHGVQKLDPKGQKFDPNRHQAMFEVPSDAGVPGTVAEVVQDGYVIGERVLRGRGPVIRAACIHVGTVVQQQFGNRNRGSLMKRLLPIGPPPNDSAFSSPAGSGP